MGVEPAFALEAANERLSFAAIDFETADVGRDSACCIGIVWVAGERIVRRERRLIRPPRRTFCFTGVHGIRWQDVVGESPFEEVWATLEPLLDGVQFLAAHNAAFDRSVLRTCCRKARLKVPTLPFRCSMRMARRAWRMWPTRLPDVCARLKIPLRHHDALSDAEACARIMIAATAPVLSPTRQSVQRGGALS
jgi:DNA polymerase III subunit epsilon